MPFVQVIEFRTDKIDEILQAMDEWLESSAGWRTSSRATLAQERDRPGTYVQIVEFPSFEAAMENSNRSETGAFAERMTALCSGPATFRNLDVIRRDDM